MKRSLLLLALSVFISSISALAQAPTAPVHVYAFRTAVDQVLLKWDAPSAASPAAYNIYRTGKKVGTSHETTYTDTGLTMGEAYAYSISAVNAAGNESAQSAPVDVVMPFTAALFGIGRDAVCKNAAPSPQAQKNVDAVTAMLPSLLTDADKYAGLIARLRDSSDAKVATSVNFIDMGVRMLRSVPIALTCEPNAFVWSMPPAALQSIAAALPYFYEQAQLGADPYKNAKSGVVPVKSPIDGYIDFYVFSLPAGYNPAKKYPLYLELHAASYCKWEAGSLSIPISKPNPRPANEHNPPETIYMMPCARGPGTSYTLMAQPIVLQSIADAASRFSIDPNRITVRGASMGATGAYRFSTLFPDLFSGAGALTGSPFYQMPPKDYRYDATMLAANLKDVSFVSWGAQGDAGTLALQAPFIAALQTLHAANPGSYNFRDYTDPAGHHGAVDRAMLKDGEDFLSAAVRNPFPPAVHYLTGSEQYDGAYWVHGMTRHDVNRPGEIDVQFAGNALTITTSNLKTFSLDLSPANPLFQGKSNIEAKLDGEALTIPTGSIAYLAKSSTWTASTTAPQGDFKHQGVSGPIADVFMQYPVLMVYGTLKGNDSVTGRLLADGLLQAYFGSAESAASSIHYAPFELKADKDVTAADIKTKNLVLFGTPAQNSLVARLAPKGHVSGKSISGSGGWSIVNPNPLNPARYALFVSEHANMSTLSASGINSNVLVNDWIYIDAVKGGNTRKVTSHGLFDSNWK